MVDKTVSIKSGEDESVLMIRPKTFKTGSTGWYLFGKAQIEGKRCQITGFVVEIGTKNSTTKKKEK